MLSTNILTSVLLLTVPNLVTAVTIYAFTGQQCPQGTHYQACTNIGPSTCCIVVSSNGLSGAGSANFISLPPNSLYVGYQATRDGKYCGAIATEGAGSGTHCITLNPSTGQYAGLAWFQQSSKRDEVRCTASQEADVIGLADGTEYAVGNMTREEKEHLWDLARGGARKEDIAAAYDNPIVSPGEPSKHEH